MILPLILAAGLAQAAGTSQPGVHHARLGAFVGSWTIRTRFWPRPGAPAQESGGTAEIRGVLGGRFIEQRQEGSLSGKPTSGIGFVGFDEARGRYVSVWLDDLSASILRTEGPPEPSGRVVRTRGMTRDPAGKSLRVEEVMTLVGADRFVYEAWTGPPGGKLARIMEIVYTRRRP